MSHQLDTATTPGAAVSPTTGQVEPTEKPFLIELRQERHENRQSHTSAFLPAASLHITPALRTSGLLQALEPDVLKGLIYLLTFLSPEGRLQASLFHLAEAMQLSYGKAKSRMQRLSQVPWHEEPVVIESKSENGYIAYSLNPRLIAYREAPEPAQHPTVHVNSRDRVIEYSRQHYAHPRAEVERMVARQLGQDENESEAERRLRYRLENNGLTGEQARTLILSHDPEVIERQLEWLPYRQAKNPAGYLVAAIEGDYDEPRALRTQRAFSEREFQFQPPENTPPQQGEWQDWQGQSVEIDAGETETTQAAETHAEVLQEMMSPVDEEAPEDAADKADALGPEDRWISLTPDE